jgi:hypothetical protein
MLAELGPADSAIRVLLDKPEIVEIVLGQIPFVLQPQDIRFHRICVCETAVCDRKVSLALQVSDVTI